jgi:hypothetical protein
MTPLFKKGGDGSAADRDALERAAAQELAQVMGPGALPDRPPQWGAGPGPDNPTVGGSSDRPPQWGFAWQEGPRRVPADGGVEAAPAAEEPPRSWSGRAAPLSFGPPPAAERRTPREEEEALTGMAIADLAAQRGAPTETIARRPDADRAAAMRDRALREFLERKQRRENQQQDR